MTSGMYLERSPGKPADLDELWPCVRTAYAEIEAGKGELSPEEQQALGGRDVSGFLYWGSLSGPRPVVAKGRPAEQESALAFSGDVQVTQRYVLCLLRNGYQWPTPPSATPDTGG